MMMKQSGGVITGSFTVEENTQTYAIQVSKQYNNIVISKNVCYIEHIKTVVFSQG